MELGTTAMALIIIIICITPFIVMRFNGKKRKLALIDKLHAKAQEVSAIINHFEICGSFIIGIDEQNNFLFFHQEDGNKINNTHINLNKVKECKAMSYVNPRGKNQLIEKVELGFIPRISGENLPTFIFYDDHSENELGSELMVAKEWASRINKRLHNTQA